MFCLIIFITLTISACGNETKCEVSNLGTPPEGIEVDTEGHVPEAQKDECILTTAEGVRNAN